MAETNSCISCIECGLYSKYEKITKECEVFCEEYNACSLEITKHSSDTKTESEKQ